MTVKSGFSLFASSIFGAAFLLLSVSPLAPAQEAVVAVPLVTDQCPVVPAGGRISIDWNPLFDSPGIVNGISLFQMRFRQLDEDGVNFTSVSTLASTKHLPGAIRPIGNDFYHIELMLPRNIRPGIYKLFRAEASAVINPDSIGGPKVQMTDSPVRTRLCITVVPAKQTPVNKAEK